MLKIRNFAPVIDGLQLYPGIDLDVAQGEIIAIMGHSGCGKTSLFRAMRKQIASVGDCNVQTTQIFSVFQDHDQLFPWFSVADNLDMVCDHDWRDLARRWKIFDLSDKKPGQLSIGQKQRFTLLRGICCSRDMILCDEPLSAVDGITAITIQKDFGHIVREKNKTCLWITHNISEAKQLCDRILVINPVCPTLFNISTSDEILLASLR